MRLFVAVEISEEIKNKIAEACKGIIESNSLKNIHITLKFIGEVKDEKLDDIIKSLEKINFEPFEINFKGVGAFPNQNFINVVWVGCESKQLSELADKIDNALPDFCEKEKRPFSGHITIARPKEKIDLNEFFEKNRETDFGKMQIKLFVLKKSTLEKTGAVHETLKEFIF